MCNVQLFLLMELVRLSENDAEEIRVFLGKQDFLPVQQSLAWGRFQEELGNEVFRIGVREAGELVAYVQGFVRKLPRDFTKIEVPRMQGAGDRGQGTEALDLILGEIKNIAEKHKTIFVRFEFQKDVELQTSNYKLLTVKEENFPLATLVVDMSKPEEEILAQMKPKGRYNIRVAEKHGVTVEESRSVEEFYDLLKKTTARDGFAGHSQDYYEKMLNALGDDAKLLLAKKDGRAIAGVLLTFAGDTCTYYYGASDHEFRNLMAPYLLQWRGMQLAKERGCKYYDFLGIAPPESQGHHLAGVSVFKRKFGGEVVVYPAPRELIIKPVMYKLFKLVKKLRK